MVGEYTNDFYVVAHKRIQRLSQQVHFGARELAAWRRRMREAWREVSILGVTCDEGDHPIGHDMSVRTEVRLGSLAPEDVVVEVVHGDVGSGGGLEHTESVPLEPVERRDGLIVYQGSVPCVRTGRRGLSVRVRPVPRLNLRNPFDANLLTWWEGSA
jgi:starch phosphorylase